MTDPVSTLGSAAARVVEAADLHVWILRAAPATTSVLAACAAVLGVSPPTEPNRAAGREPRVLWLAPDEWSVVSHNGAAGLGPALAQACKGGLHHLADLHAGWTAFHIEGDGAADLISAGCSLDLHPSVFGPNRCARTLLAQVPVLVDRPPFLEGFTIYVDRSLAAHLRDWFDRAMGDDAAP